MNLLVISQPTHSHIKTPAGELSQGPGTEAFLFYNFLRRHCDRPAKYVARHSTNAQMHINTPRTCTAPRTCTIYKKKDLNTKRGNLSATALWISWSLKLHSAFCLSPIVTGNLVPKFTSVEIFGVG